MTINDTARDSTPAASPPARQPASPEWFAALSLIAGLGAVAASSCCVIPLGLAALGAGAGVLGGLEMIAEWRAPFLLTSALAIIGAWGAWWLQRPTPCVSGASCATPRSRATLGLLLCASTTLLAAASWRYIDPALLKLLRGR